MDSADRQCKGTTKASGRSERVRLLCLPHSSVLSPAVAYRPRHPIQFVGMGGSRCLETLSAVWTTRILSSGLTCVPSSRRAMCSGLCPAWIHCGPCQCPVAGRPLNGTSQVSGAPASQRGHKSWASGGLTAGSGRHNRSLPVSHYVRAGRNGHRQKHLPLDPQWETSKLCGRLPVTAPPPPPPSSLPLLPSRVVPSQGA